MTYAAWGKDGEACMAGVELTESQRLCNPDAERIKVFDAASFNDAMRQYYEWQGWEPYKPMLDADGNEYPEDNANG